MEIPSKQKIKDVILKNLNLQNTPVTPQLIAKIDTELEKAYNKMKSI
jgi:hypothetical protein